MHKKLLPVLIGVALVCAAPPAVAQESRDAQPQTGMIDAPAPNYSDSMARLQEAAQRVRQAIQQIAQQPAGERRDAALEQAHEALYDTQQAMMRLPPELYLNEGMKAQPNYTVATERLQQAAQKLRESVQAMAEQPAGARRNEAAREARDAILATQQAMIHLPPHMRSQLGAKLTADKRADAARGMGGDLFARLDADGDGRISRSEFESEHAAR